FSRHHEISESDALCIFYTCLLQGRTQLRSRQLLVPLESLFQHPVAFFNDRSIQFLLTVHETVHRMDTRSAQCQHPADILRRDKMPGGPQDMRAQDSSFVERFVQCSIGRLLQAQTQRPFASAIILGLNRAKPLYHLARFREICLGKELIMESIANNVYGHME